MKQTTLIELICFLLVLLFIYAALSKLSDFISFRSQLNRSPFIGSLSGPLSFTIPFIELLTATLLILVQLRLFGLYASAKLMILFTIYISAMLIFSKHLPCACGGVLKQMTWRQHLLFNLFFLSLSVTGVVVQKRIKHKNIVV